MRLAVLREWIVRAGLLGRRGDADLEAELRSHQELAGEARMAATPVRRSELASGHAGTAQAMDALRDQRGLPWVDDFLRDARHAFRILRRNPVFTAAAVLSLALGIGANSAIFSLADALILRPLPVPDPGGVVTISADAPEEGFAGGTMSYPNYRDLRERARSFDALTAYKLFTAAVALSRDAAREMKIGVLVSDNYFSGLGVQPSIGRSFSPEEARVPGRDAVVVLSDDFWRSAYGADPSIVNRVVWLNGIDFHVLGVAPASFTGTEPPVRPAFYVPAVMARRLNESRRDVLEDREARDFTIKGRLARGISRRSAQAELTTLWAPMARDFPAANGHRTMAVRTELEARVQADPWDAATLALLFALVGLVLVIACANVANLMLGRVRARAREMAVRLALGVGRTRLLRQLLTESLMLSFAGCIAGLGFAYLGIRFLRTIPVGDQIVIDPALDTRVLVVSVIAAVASAAVFGLAPARQSLATALVPALKNSESSEPKRSRTTGRNVLVVAQVATSMVLLVATGVLLDGFRKVLVLDPGFRTDRLLMLTLDPSLVRYSPEQTRTFYRTLVDRVRALPNVRSVALSAAVPFSIGNQRTEGVVPDGYHLPPGQDSFQTSMSVIDEAYFDTMQIRLTRGRAFTAADTAEGRPVAIVNEEFASRYWPNQNPIGKRIRLSDRRDSWREIVGVTATGKYLWIAELPTPFVYLPFAQQRETRMSLLVESATPDASSLATPVRDVIRTLDVNQPIANLQTYSHLYHQRAITVPSIIMQTVGAIALVGLTLALIGLYGLVAYSVARRTREIGIRMAIGAAKADVLSMVLRQGLRLAIAGIVLGGLISVAVVRILSTILVGLGTPSPAVYVIVPLVLAGLTAVASYFPARRASLVDPLVALRYD